jgi:DNA mismatch repair ATPase MutS
MGKGQAGARFLDERHPNAVDLDLFGNGSLYELLCTVRTRKGEDTLAAWLLAPAPVEEIRGRQEAIAELRPRLELREEFALLGEEVPSGIDLATLVAWGAASPVLRLGWARIAAAVLPAATLIALAAWWGESMGPAPFLAALAIQGGFALWLMRRVQRVVKPVEHAAHDLALFAGILGRIEGERFASSHLRGLREKLETSGVSPSRRIAQLGRLADWLSAPHNQFFALFAPLLLWTTQLAFAVEAWRRTAGSAIAHWFEVVGEFEALCALAAYAYENPLDPVPEIVDGGPCFAGEALGHPLMPTTQCVRNDVCLGGELRLLVVSGSNMSGKSTLLRTVGINAVLALAGAPVRARRLRISPLVVGATLHVQDSLQAGRSRFYTEILRVRQFLDLANGSPPLLFLLDEFLLGTNSHDRRVGAEAVIRNLLDYGAFGLITTHDLALAEIADRLASRAANVHFEDHFEGRTLTFDYQMRPGIVTTSNALALMRAAGIEI